MFVALCHAECLCDVSVHHRLIQEGVAFIESVLSILSPCRSISLSICLSLCLSGLQRIYSLTRSGGYELRIDMADFDNATAFAHYADFSVGRDSVNPEEDGYPLTVDQYSGTAGSKY